VVPSVQLPIDAMASSEDPVPCDDWHLVRTPAGEQRCEPALRETMPNGATYTLLDHKQQPLDDYIPRSPFRRAMSS
jgi:signal peptidase I